MEVCKNCNGIGINIKRIEDGSLNILQILECPECTGNYFNPLQLQHFDFKSVYERIYDIGYRDGYDDGLKLGSIK